jgi:hypothetical protein
MQGTIVQVNTSRGGLPKRAVKGGFISEIGLEGDEHAHPWIHGGAQKAILLIAAEIVDDLIVRGYPWVRDMKVAVNPPAPPSRLRICRSGSSSGG